MAKAETVKRQGDSVLNNGGITVEVLRHWPNLEPDSLMKKKTRRTR